MAESEHDRYQFFVYIVESPSAPDLYHGRSEGSRVADTLRLDGISCVTRTTINSEAFLAALSIGLPEVMKQFPGHYPILHLSAHGSSGGIQLSTSEVVSWHQLRDLLVPINQSLQGTLLLCMSACEGYNACQMAMQEEDVPHPYALMVGNFGKPTWSDTAVAYLAFYHLLAKGRSLPEAISAMAAASGDKNWVAETADQSKHNYVEYLKAQATPSEVQRQLENAAQEQVLPANAKSLESGVTR
jgi:hypothetical protein